MNILLFHGKDADPTMKWYPWFIESMREIGIDCIAPALPNTADPLLSEWVASINAIQPTEESVLIGHSRGGVAILRWLETLAEGRKVKAVILIATNSGYNEKISSTENSKSFFSEHGYDFTKIKQHCDTFIVFHSRDDLRVPFEAGEENAQGLDAEFLQFDGRGHFGKMIHDIPELIDEIKKLMPRP